MSEGCGPQLLCGPGARCVGVCDAPFNPGAIETLVVTPHPDPSESHRYARLRFSVPESVRALMRYEVRFSTDPIVDEESFMRARPAVQASLDSIELTVPVEGAPGEEIEVDLGGMRPETTYDVAIRAIDECNAPGPLAFTKVTTTEIHFTTVSPCFVATAAYGSPLEARVGALRRFRDRHLKSNALGRAIVDVYYAIGPYFADAIRGSDKRRKIARTGLSPLVWFAEAAP